MTNFILDLWKCLFQLSKRMTLTLIKKRELKIAKLKIE